MIKNIVLIYPSYERGGVKKNFLSYLDALNKKNINIYIISDKKILGEVKRKKNIKIFITKNYKLNSIYKYITSMSSAYKIFQIKNLINTNNSRVISFQSSFFSSIICKILGFKLIVRVSEDPLGATKYSDNFVLGFMVMLSKIITYNLSYKILANSEMMKLNLKKLVFYKKKIVLQHNMHLKSIKNFNIQNKKNIFLNIGRFCKQKNQNIILKAFQLFVEKNKNYQLYLCGDGPDSQKLKNLCINLNLTKYVKFFAWKEDTKKFLLKSKYFVFPSLYEGLPNVLIDAVNNDLVCVCSEVSGVSDICGKDYISINKNNEYEVFSKMQLAVNKYKQLVKKNIFKKKKLDKFLFKKLKNRLIENIK